MNRVFLPVAIMLMLAISAASAGELPLKLRGSIMVTAGVRSGERVEIVLQADRFTSDETVHELGRVLFEQGENALLHQIQGLPVAGWVEIGGSHRTELRAVRSLGNGPVRQLRFLTSPAIRYDDLWLMARSPDYNYGFVELVIDETGVGDGTIIPAATIEISDGRIRIASLGSYAFRILQVRADSAGEYDTHGNEPAGEAGSQEENEKLDLTPGNTSPKR